MNKCGGCGRFASQTDTVKCKKCLNHFHRSCVGILARDRVPLEWHCPECKRPPVARQRNDETPVRATQPDRVSDSETGPMSPDRPILSRKSEESHEGFGGREFGLLMEEIKAFRMDVKKFQRQMEMEMAALRESVQTCGSRVDGIEARLQALEDAAKTESIERVVENLRRELNDRDQELLANDVEISNVPEQPGENPVHLLKSLGAKLGVTLDERDVVSVERVGRRALVATSPQGPREARPRVLVARLARRDVRDELLRSARMRRAATTEGVAGTAPPRRFYVNERLTRTNRQLFREAREVAGAAGWRFVWTKRGQVLVCRRPGDPTHRVRSGVDLATLCGQSAS